MFTLPQIESLGARLLVQTQQPVARFRLLREVMRVSDGEDALQKAHAALLNSRWVEELAQAQQADGSWGRFHSRDSALRLRFPTSELALYRARALGLSPEEAFVQRSLQWMEAILMGKAAWSDPAEKHEGWPINTRFITAGTLALFDSANPFLPPLADRWVKVVNATFANGTYDPVAERQAHLEANGIHSAGKYLKLAALYPLALLATHTVRLDTGIEERFLRWLCEKRDGIYYVYGGCLLAPPALTAPHFQNWLDALGLILRFKSGRSLCEEAFNWLWNQQQEGFWDFGAAARQHLYFPLSESWRNVQDRRIDCSISVLSLLRAYRLVVE